MSGARKLPESAQPAWQAYRAMERTKRQHIDLLKRIEQRERHGGPRTFAEQVRLDRLLEAHDEAVLRFRRAMQVLADDKTAHGQFLEHLQKHNQSG